MKEIIANQLLFMKIKEQQCLSVRLVIKLLNLLPKMTVNCRRSEGTLLLLDLEWLLLVRQRSSTKQMIKDPTHKCS